MNRLRSVFRLALPTTEPPAAVLPRDQSTLDALLLDAERLGVFAAVFSSLRQAGVELRSDEGKRRIQANAAHNLFLKAEQQQVLRVLGEAGVVALPVRGISLTERLYPDLSWRAIADIDLLVEPGDIHKTYAALKNAGMGDAENPWSVEALGRLARRSALHYPELRLVSPQGASVEVHWDWVEHSLPKDDLCSAPEAYLVYLSRHAGKHFWYDLRWLADIELFLGEFAATLDWDLVWRLARANQATRSCAATFQLCGRIFGRELHADLQRHSRAAGGRLARSAEEWLVEGRRHSFWDRPVVQLLRVDGWENRIRRILGWLAPTPRHWTRPDGSTHSSLEVWVGRVRRFAFLGLAAVCPSNGWRRRLRKAAELSTGAWWLLLRAWLLLPVMSIGMRAVGYPRLHAWAGRVRPVTPPAQAVERAGQLGLLVKMAAARHFGKFACLPRSLTLLRLLGQQGIEAKLKLGVRREDGRVEGHAWVEFDGTAINEPGDPDQDFGLLRRAGSDPLALVGRAER